MLCFQKEIANAEKKLKILEVSGVTPVSILTLTDLQAKQSKM